MTIKQLGGVFGRNPTFNDVTIEGQLTFDGDIDVNSDLKVDGNLEVIDDLTVDTNSLYVNSTNNEVCIGQLTSINAGKFNVKGDSAHNGISATPYADTYYNYYGTNAAGGSTFYVRGDGISNFQGAMTVEAQLNNTGNHVITNGNVVVSSGNGIDFSATAGTGTSELLSDYEEGAFSPTYTTSGTDFDSVSYVVVYGNYVKIGTLVYATGFIRTSSITVGSASGIVKIGGLPFARTGSMDPPVYISGAEGWAGDVPIGGLVSTDQTITLQYRTAANTSYLNTAITDLATSGSNDIRFTAMYRVSY